uniref:transposase n=1 Tax=Clostridium thailandense TaxID=2794346 RepID=UPI0028AB90C7|nr:transposase [Clostridium thailandense]
MVKTTEVALKYVGRYAARPAIAESRITKYDGKKVTFYYERHEDGKRVEETIDVIDFIGKLIRHIPEKGFKMIRYYGTYAKSKKHKEKFFKLMREVILETKRKLRKKILSENKRKLEELMHTYGAIKGLIHDKMEPLYIGGNIMGKKNKKIKDKQMAKFKAKNEKSKEVEESIQYVCTECG